MFLALMLGKLHFDTPVGDPESGNEWGIDDTNILICSQSITEWEERQLQQVGEEPSRGHKARWRGLRRRQGELEDGREWYWKPDVLLGPLPLWASGN